LADAVQGLRQELTCAVAAADGEVLRFELGSIEVEFAVTVRRNGDADAGVNFGVVALGGRAGMSAETLHLLKLTLNPKDLVTGRPPQVSGHVDQIPPR
jgi:hypothetical protein